MYNTKVQLHPRRMKNDTGKKDQKEQKTLFRQDPSQSRDSQPPPSPSRSGPTFLLEIGHPPLDLPQSKSYRVCYSSLRIYGIGWKICESHSESECLRRKLKSH